MSIRADRRFRVTCGLLAGVGIALLTTRGDAQRFEYVVTFDNVVVQGIDGVTETPALAHLEVPTVGQRKSLDGGEDRPSGDAQCETPDSARREPGSLLPREPRSTILPREPGSPPPCKQGSGLSREPLVPDQRGLLSAERTISSRERATDRILGSERIFDPARSGTARLLDPLDSAPPGRGLANPSFVQEGFLIEAFWAVKTGTGEAYFKRAHFHPPDLSSGFEAQHLGNPDELHGIFIRSLDGKRFGLKSLKYRVTRNRQLPNKPLSIDGFSNFNVNVLVARSFDPRGPIRAQFVSFPVGLPLGNDLTLPWWSLRIFGFELVDQVYIASSASVDFDNIVLTRREPPASPPRQPEEGKQ
jgi:hypothetical protein